MEKEKKENKKVRDLTNGSPIKLILGFMLPLLLGMLFQQLYSMVDTIIVGQTLGIEALAGVGSTGSINFLVIGFVLGISAGFAIPVAQQFGSKDFDALRKYVANTIWATLFFAAVLTVVTTVGCSWILRVMNTPENVFSKAYNYIFVIFLGIPATFLYNILSGFMRSLGDSKTPLIFLIISSVLNVALDLFMIVVLKLDVTGAALATVISQLISGVMSLVYVIKKFDILHLRREDLKPSFYYIGRLCAVGVPMGLQYSITAIGSILVQTAVNSLGSASMAAVTSGSKVSMLMCCPFDAMGSTMATYGGQNIGAGKPERVKKGLFSCSMLGIGWSVLALGIVALFGRGLVMMFIEKNGDTSPAEIESIAALGKQFLITNAAFYIPLAFVNIVRFLIQGMGFSQFALFAGVFELVARGAVALLAVPRFGFSGLCFANPAAWILADMFLIPAFFVCYNHVKKRTGQV